MRLPIALLVACSGASSHAPPRADAAADVLDRDARSPAPDAARDASSADAAPAAGDGWPARHFAPYVDVTAYPTPRIADIAARTGVRRFTLAFVVARGAGDCAASWGGVASIDDGPSAWNGGAEYTLYDQIAALRAAGGDVMVSFGGAAGTPIEAACATADAVLGEYERVIDRLALTRIDFDVEGAAIADAAASTRRSEALATLQARRAAAGRPLHVWFTLPVLPDGLTPDGVAVLRDAVAHGVAFDGANAMTMDYGDSAAPDPAGRMGELGIAAIGAMRVQLASALGGAAPWAMIGTTPMIGRNDVADEAFLVEDAMETRAFADAHGVGRIAMWSVNRDHPCATDQTWASPDCNGFAGVGDGSYASVFAGYGD